MSGSRIVKYSPGEPYESLTDWEALERLTEAEIEARASADPDNPPLTDEQLETAQPVRRGRRPRVSTAPMYGDGHPDS